jgi:hypothetical protein
MRSHKRCWQLLRPRVSRVNLLCELFIRVFTLDDRLLSMISEEGEDAMEEQRCETDQGAHGERDAARFLGRERV